MKKLTTEKYRCADCKKLKRLVIVRGSASRCKGCYESHLVESRTIRELNKMARVMIG
jgi:hypothetical protein